MINLTAEERTKFAAWLKQDAESDRLLLEQLVKIGAIEPLKRIHVARRNAKLVVAHLLESIEEQVIG